MQLPNGELISERELGERVHSGMLPMGLYEGVHDDVVGSPKIWCIPPIEENLTKILYALQNIHNYKALANEYIQLIQTDPAIKWHLIIMLLREAHYRTEFKALSKVRPWSKTLLECFIFW